MIKYELRSVKNGARIQKKMVRVTKPQAISETKGSIRNEIGTRVGDTETILGQLSDTVSLLTSTLSALYFIQDPEKLAILPLEQRQSIEYLFSKFASTVTSADLDFAEDPIGTIDNLIKPQGEIGNIMAEIKGV